MAAGDVDQRGGRSTLMLSCRKHHFGFGKDIEKLRTHLGIEQWVVFGGS